MRAEGGMPGIRHAAQHRSEERADFIRGRIPDRIGQVDGGAAGGDHFLNDPAQEVRIASRGILG